MLRTAMALCLLLAAMLAGCVGEQPTPSTVPTAPDAVAPGFRIEWSPLQPEVGQTIRFQLVPDDPSEPASDAAWDFGDGTSRTAMAPEKSYREAGAYTVRVDVLTAGDHHSIAQAQVRVQPPPDAGAPGEPTDPEEPDPSPGPPANHTGNNTGAPSPTDTASPPEWGSPDGKGIRPGINMVTGSAGCTTSFLFTEGWNRYFIATAAHCVAAGSSDDTNGCTAPLRPIGSMSTLQLAGSGTLDVPLVYSSWNTMQQKASGDNNACLGNDFALLEIPLQNLAQAHPASLHFQAPTGLAHAPTTELWGYGASSLKFGLAPAHPKQGIHLGTNNGGWSHLVYLGTPGIPGDSGGHILTDDGKALGVLSTVILTPYPAANHYTDVVKSIAFAKQHTGLDVQLITWDDFRPGLI